MEESKCIISKRRKILNNPENKDVILIRKFPFNIPHIFDQILIYCDKTLLLQCRFVSSSWRKASTFHLNKITTIWLFDNDCTIKHKGKTLDDLNKVFKNLEKLDSPNKEFICTHFRFTSYKRTCCDSDVDVDVDVNAKEKTMLISYPPLRNFISTYGAYVQKLALFFFKICDAHILTQEVLMDDIEKLLTVNLPNLKSFYLHIGSEYQGANITESFPLSLTRIQRDEIHSQYNILITGRNYNLKKVSFAGKVSATVIEMVQVLAPNLKEIRLESDKILCLLEPLNRINFLRIFNFFPWKVAQYSIFDKLAECCSKQILKLRVLSFFLTPFVPPGCNDYTPQMLTRIIDIISTILECSWDSLEEICWFGVATTTGLKWPQQMPRVKSFLFTQNATIEKKIFPLMFSWCKTFPCLREVSIYICVKDVIPLDLFRALNLEPMKRVNIVRTGGLDLNEVDKIELKAILRTNFPNANISLNCKRL